MRTSETCPRKAIALTFSLSLIVASQALADSPYQDAVYLPSETDNIQYGTGLTNNGASTKALMLDVYRPVVDPDYNIPVPTNTPAIILVHGGGFESTTENKSEFQPLADVYASLGYVVYSIDYRLYGDLPPNSSPGPADNFTPPPPGFDSFADLQLGDNANQRCGAGC